MRRRRSGLIGFSGSPWTLACYMVEGAGSEEYRHIKTMMYARPDLLHRILAINAEQGGRCKSSPLSTSLNNCSFSPFK